MSNKHSKPKRSFFDLLHEKFWKPMLPQAASCIKSESPLPVAVTDWEWRHPPEMSRSKPISIYNPRRRVKGSEVGSMQQMAAAYVPSPAAYVPSPAGNQRGGTIPTKTTAVSAPCQIVEGVIAKSRRPDEVNSSLGDWPVFFQSNPDGHNAACHAGHNDARSDCCEC